jgi:hypothetical protein
MFAILLSFFNEYRIGMNRLKEVQTICFVIWHLLLSQKIPIIRIEELSAYGFRLTTYRSNCRVCWFIEILRGFRVAFALFYTIFVLLFISRVVQM